MNNDIELKNIVREKYGEIAKSSKSCCCGSSKIVDYTIMKDNYDHLQGYVKEADLGLGCGIPTEFANINPGNIVIDLGSGAGNDVFVARSIVGETGLVIGVDMTEDMIDLAEKNKTKLGIENVQFRLGEIEQLPIEDNFADVVLSNCVLNLVPNKEKAFSEIYRVLKEDGHFCISDIVLLGELPAQLRKSAELYAGCVSGALQQNEYISLIEKAGFKDVKIVKSKTITLPDSVLKQYLNPNEIEEYKKDQIGVFSITVYGNK
jgi:SAM-dependent methyltransferase